MKVVLVFCALLVATLGQEPILTAPGIIEPDVEQCEKELYRYQTWDDGIFFPPSVLGHLPQIYEAEIDHSFNLPKHQLLLQKMDNYSNYQNALPDMRGEGDYEDCKDLCPSTSIEVGAVAIENITYDSNGRPQMGICLVVYPEFQNFKYQSCVSQLALNVPWTNDFQMKYACVPDGFIRRKLIVFCPTAAMGQCREVEVSVPMACSPKLAKCTFTDDYVKKMNAEKARKAEEKQASGLSSLLSRSLNRGSG
ncbi:uncharacterized protein LOC132552235 [Ylistrum balloti]|uniref:uncharacterized protein LOC132552235 n=1 Tax=Ylistrum balloti TaxID=509963 RepID=UPI002905A684|nr:uncharacterized protein LOC132552235 [Ylistrum balloti]